MVLFGEVREVEVAGEGARHLLRPLQRPGGDQLLRLALLVVILPGLDDRPPEALHVVQQLGAPVFAQHLAEQLAEQSHVAAQGRGDLGAGAPAQGIRLAHRLMVRT